MPSIIGDLTDRYPQLPKILANTVVGKVIQLIKSKAIDPAFDRERTVQTIQSWPPTLQKIAEWVMYTLSGVVRTMPNQEHPVGIIIQEGLAEALTQVGMKIDDVSVADRMEIIDVTMPVIRGQLVANVQEDSKFRERINTIFGTAQDWSNVLQGAETAVGHIRDSTKANREARKARGWGRFLWKSKA